MINYLKQLIFILSIWSMYTITLGHTINFHRASGGNFAIPNRLAFIPDLLSFKKQPQILFNQASSSSNKKERNVFLFPGQGAQNIGMGIDSADNIEEARHLFNEASNILGYDLLDICKNGPKTMLDTTEVAQPAIFVCSMAAAERWKIENGLEKLGMEDVAMGLSLGEYSALCFAKVLSFHDALKIVMERGKAMQMAADSSDSGMVAVLGLSSDKVEEICQYVKKEISEPIEIANYLSTGNYVVSGSTNACNFVVKIAKPKFKALKAVKLAVAGAFHTSYMKPAAQKLQDILETSEFHKPKLTVISNVDAEAHEDPFELKDILLKQLTQPVQWEKSLKKVANMEFDKFYELGPGTVLSGIMKRINKNISVRSFQ